MNSADSLLKYLGSHTIVPFQLDFGPGDNSHRIGGRAPEGLTPNSPDSKYLLTMGIDGETFLSIFLKYDASYYIEHSKEFQGEGGAVEVIFHTARPRRKDDAYASVLTPHALALLPGAPDILEEGREYTPNSGNKIGGRAYSLSIGGHFSSSIERQRSHGFEQFLQLDISGLNRPGLLIGGDMPMGDGQFHLFLKRSGSSLEWQCFWEN